MCQYCMEHGHGKVWYKNAMNYARQMYKLKKREGAEDPRQKEMDPETQAGLIVAQAIEAKTAEPERYPELKKMANRLVMQSTVGQVVTIQEAMDIVDLASPIALMSCVCRKMTRGKVEDDERSYTCMGLGIGMFKWDRWPERYKGGVEFITPDQAKEWLKKWNKKGMMHSIMTHGTPYIGGICNCDYPDCLPIRYRLDYGVNHMIKGHWVAKVDYDKCDGCGICVSRCQFGAIKKEVTTGKTNIDMMRCFGCGLCQTGCKKGAVTMIERTTVPGLRGVW
ncbi:MAG: ATP-binding protein [Bacillota bacterium]